MSEERGGTSWKAWGLGVAVLLVLIVVLQNSQEVKVDVLFATFDAPLIVTLLVAVAIGAGIGYATPLILRHRREEKRRED